MPVKRSLKLDDPFEAHSFEPSRITRKRGFTNYSPSTGTCRLSPYASPTNSKEQEHKNGPTNGKKKKLNHLSLTQRNKSTTKDDELGPTSGPEPAATSWSWACQYCPRTGAETAAEQQRAYRSDERGHPCLVPHLKGNAFSFCPLNMMLAVGLSCCLYYDEALKDSRKLQNLIGISYGPCFLKREMKKTKELMTKVIKQKLFEKKSSELSNKELRQLDSYEFLKAILN
ncbi:PREDICTED: centromere protein R [Myotis brandtii]|uniref:centromere protein R n=1 Tax=Myotis brandtii TaxID=109478 RepID=UPI0007043CC6|nr:PREDICTED: centromere protein R [Myotis brandtii]